MRQNPASRPYKHRTHQSRAPAPPAVSLAAQREWRDDRPSQVAPARSRFIPRAPTLPPDSPLGEEWLPRASYPGQRTWQPHEPQGNPRTPLPLLPKGPRHGYACPPALIRSSQPAWVAQFPSLRKQPLVAPFVPLCVLGGQRPPPSVIQTYPHPAAPTGSHALPPLGEDPDSPPLLPRTHLIVGSLALLPTQAAACSSSAGSIPSTAQLRPRTPPPSVMRIACPLAPDLDPDPDPDPCAARSRLTSPSDPNPPWLAAALYGPSFEEMEWRKALRGAKRARADEDGEGEEEEEEDEEEERVTVERGAKRRKTAKRALGDESTEMWLDLAAWEAQWKARARRERAGHRHGQT
ncbi:hypothetical protein JCM3770_003112 [Rhodotorula araucariae]